MKDRVLVCEGTYTSTLAVVRSLGKKGLKVIVADKNRFCISKASRYAHKKLICPPTQDEKKFIDWLLNLARSNEFDIFLPTSDLLIWYAQKYKSDLSDYIILKLPPQKALDIALFKNLTYKKCIELGVPCPKTYFVESMTEIFKLSEKIKYPVIIKKTNHVCLEKSEKGNLVSSKLELVNKYRKNILKDGNEKTIKKYPDIIWPILQEFISYDTSNLYNVSGFINDEGKVVCVTSEKKVRKRPTRIGIGICIRNYYDKELIGSALKFLNGIGYKGMFQMEFCFDEKEKTFKLFDVNPRAHATLQMIINKGLDTPWLWYQSIFGEVKPFDKVMIDKDIIHTHLISDLFNFPGQFILRKNKFEVIKEYLETILRARSFAVLDIKDFMPFIIDILANMRVFLHPREYLKNTFKGE